MGTSSMEEHMEELKWQDGFPSRKPGLQGRHFHKAVTLAAERARNSAAVPSMRRARHFLS